MREFASWLRRQQQGEPLSDSSGDEDQDEEGEEEDDVDDNEDADDDDDSDGENDPFNMPELLGGHLLQSAAFLEQFRAHHERMMEQLRGRAFGPSELLEQFRREFSRVHGPGLLRPAGAPAGRAATGAAVGAVLAALPRVPFKADLFSGSPHPQACPICMEDFAAEGPEGREIVLTPCFHTFHESCLGGWLARNKECPSCRWDVTDTGERKAHESSRRIPCRAASGVINVSDDDS